MRLARDRAAIRPIRERATACSAHGARIGPGRRTVAIAGVLAQVSRAGLHAYDRIDRYVESEMQLNAIPGVAGAIVEVGAVPVVRAYGCRNTLEQSEMTEDTPAELAVAIRNSDSRETPSVRQWVGSNSRNRW